MATDPKSRVQPVTDETNRPISLFCTCGKLISIAAEEAGEEIRCGDCGSLVVVDPFTTKPSLLERTESIADVPPKASSRSGSKVTLRDFQEILAPAQSADEIGRLGPYRVLQVLGAGGMGIVFKAQDTRLVRVVAVKAMLPSVAERDSAKERFLREARAAAALSHDHVVSIFDVGEDRNIPYLAMEFLDGESLEACLKREGRLGVREAVRIGKEIADGLGAAHELGLIHRDIKPANVWLETRAARRKEGLSDSANRPSARVKILDFGLVRGADDASLTQSGALLGTPAYMSLEQAKNEHLDGRCDLYSLGVVLYRMVTGEMPFQGNNLITVLAAMMSATPVEPMKHNPSIPAKLNDLILRLLSKNADDRPASASVVFDALTDVEAAPAKTEAVAPLAAMPTTAPESNTSPPVPTPVAPQTERPRRWPRLSLAIGSVAVAAVIFGVVNRPNIRDVEVAEAKKTPPPAVVERIVPQVDDPVLKVDPPIPKIDLTPKKADPPVAPTSPPKADPPPEKVEPKQVAEPKAVEPKKNPVPAEKPAPFPPTAKAGDKFTNAAGIELVYVPPGSFTMGSPKSEQDWVRKTFGDAIGEWGAQETQHKVEITRGFYLGRYAVTQAEYAKVMGKNPSSFSSTGDGKEAVADLDTGRFPVESVSWEDAKEYCSKLSAKEGKEYRLPTEAEWEYACRAETTTAYNVGPTLSEGDANFGGRIARTVKVETYPANAWDLCDMHGNVCQWCEDRYGANYYKDSPAQDPKGPAEGSGRVTRGGDWKMIAGGCRSANRGSSAASYRSRDLGFRIVLASVKFEPPETAPRVAVLPKQLPDPKPAPVPIAKEPGVGMTNSIGMKLVFIPPPKKFTMGSPKEEEGHFDDEFQHEVEISTGFYLGRYAVTQDEYSSVMGNNPSYFSPIGGGKAKVAGVDTSRFPVESVSWDDAKEFCRKLSIVEGKVYRLPTEAEWEYACRAGTVTAYNVGKMLLDRDANFDKKAARPVPVGTYDPNAWGLYDMHGNVSQWCEDWFGKNYYEDSPVRDPEGPSTGSGRVLRGGDWYSNAKCCRSAYRNSHAPTFRDDAVGFRVVLSFAKVKSPPPPKEEPPPVAKVEPPVEPVRPIPVPVPVPIPVPVPAEVKPDPEITARSIGMKLVYIAPKTFMMGSPNTEEGHFRDELQHEVEITRGFYLGKYTVTQEEYTKLMGTNPSWFSSTGGGKEKVAGLETSRFPVEMVTWQDAKEFCRRLSAREGKEFRLPTEAEWELACRAGTTTAYNVGDTLTERDANFDQRSRPVAVGSYAANAWGLCEMHGNVWQWCEDWYGADYYSVSPARDPSGPAVGQRRVIRGGFRSAVATLCRSAGRGGAGPTERGGDVGFRVAVQAVK